jgi:RNA polymerase sigma factor (sigma-70 family)
LKKENLIQLYCAGQNDAFAILFGEWQTEFYFFVFKHIKNELETEDILFDCVEKMLNLPIEKRVQKFITDKVEIKSFIFLVLKNRCLDFTKQKSNRLRILDSLKSVFKLSDRNEAENQFDLENIESSFGVLNDREKVILLKSIEGYSIEEIGNEYQISRKTVSNLLYESRKKIKLFLKIYSN